MRTVLSQAAGGAVGCRRPPERRTRGDASHAEPNHHPGCLRVLDRGIRRARRRGGMVGAAPPAPAEAAPADLRADVHHARVADHRGHHPGRAPDTAKVKPTRHPEPLPAAQRRAVYCPPRRKSRGFRGGHAGSRARQRWRAGAWSGERERDMGLEIVNPVAARRPVREWMEDVRRRTATTPGHLRMLSVVIAAVAIVLMLVGSGALVTALSTVNGIQQRTVPDVVGMQHVHAWLADADRSAASAFLAGDADNTVSQLQFDTESAATNLDLLGRINPDDPQFRYAADIAAASRELQRATDQPGVSPDATQRLQAIAQSIGYYTSLVTTAGALEPTDLPGGTVYLQAATNLMHGKGGILDQVDGLRDLYVGDLNGANVTLEVSAGMLLLYAAVALVLLWLLLKTQRYVTSKFRRRRNGRLVAATLLLLVVSGGGALGTYAAAQSIRTGESESYIRLLNLWNARSLLYDANTNESLSLIAVGKGQQFDQAFQTDTIQLVDRPLTTHMIQDATNGQVDFNGLLADELRLAQ